ncbi:hypothetical protein E8F11_22845 [Pseudomonas sp. BN417]|uniref:hypothetical protein n=1 Tax=Pseudomonas sp. BN417 TaxID=2567890 RepID=UPI0024589AD2|nr:hypothetical protein [Pseudomonas sp. BN417]MDH4557977.1 hypothetical protein [Pseudomonas sp. BN417]
MAFSTRESWLKVERARQLLSGIYESLGEFLDGYELDIPIENHADHERGCISVRITALPSLPQDLGLIIGDIAHNYRCALDYLWWQLATHNLGREPTDEEAPSIQFPILKESDKWGKKGFRFVSLDDAAFVEKYQPFSFDTTDDSYTPLEGLNVLSNHDKHRVLTPVIARALKANYVNTSGQELRGEWFELPQHVVVGTEVIRFFADLDGLDVATAITGSFRAYLAVQNDWNVLQLFEAIDLHCDSILKEAGKRFG